MMKRKALLTLMAASMLTIGGGTLIHAAFDENLNMYTLDAVVVEADKTKNKFGDTITEQSYYRTGGDVKVITREEIEKRHYTDVTEAIKRIPGVTFQNPGYRGGEYGSAKFNNGVAINGDYHVVILVDGRRVDNSASYRTGSDSTSSKATGVNLNHVTNVENIDKIEVIKGPGASAYGADASGGVINIITRKGGAEPVATVDVSTGSWKQHNYAVSYSGSTGSDKSVKYFISANRNMSGDSKFIDGHTGTEAKFYGSRWKEEGVDLRVDKEFDENRNLKISYNHKSGSDGYPIWTPLTKYWNKKDFQATLFRSMVGKFDENYKLTDQPMEWNSSNPGYKNLFQIDSSIYGSYNRFNNNDLDVVYTFNKENGMESFIRFYDQKHTYISGGKYVWGYLNGQCWNNAYLHSDDPNAPKVYPFYDDYMSKFPNGTTYEKFQEWYDEHLCPFPGADKATVQEWLDKTGGPATDRDRHSEKNRGLQLQYAKSIGIHDVITSVTYDKSKVIGTYRNRTNGTSFKNTERKSVQAYVQDKIHVTDKWDVTPAVRYSWYSAFSHTKDDGTKYDDYGNASSFSYALNSEYMFNDTTSMYFGWSRIFRPLREQDYSTPDQLAGGHLDDEKGNAWTIGVRKELSDKTTLNVNYALTKMSNSIAALPIFNVNTGKWTSYKVNAKEDQQSFNVTLDTQINDKWTVSAGYDHMKDKWKSKNGWVLGPEYDSQKPDDLNVAINKLRPQNHYSLNIAYDNDKFYSGLLVNWYTGNDDTKFSAKRYLILDWNINYQISKDVTLYALVNNLTNEGYETTYSASYGGAAMPGRSVLVGAKYTF